MLLGGWNRLANFLEQLHGLLVHAEHGARGIVRLFIRLQHFLHAGDELGIGLRRNHPVFELAIRHAVFFNVRRSVSRLTASTIASSTTLRASSRKVQFA
jgi:hypothetical protein